MITSIWKYLSPQQAFPWVSELWNRLNLNHFPQPRQQSGSFIWATATKELREKLAQFEKEPRKTERGRLRLARRARKLRTGLASVRMDRDGFHRRSNSLWKLKERLWNELLFANNKIKELKANSASLTADNVFLGKQNELLRSGKETLEEELQVARKQRDDVVDQRDAEVKETAALRAELEVLQKKLQQAENKKNEASDAINRVIAERNVLQMKVAQYRSEWIEANLRMSQLYTGLGAETSMGESLLQIVVGP